MFIEHDVGDHEAGQPEREIPKHNVLSFCGHVALQTAIARRVTQCFALFSRAHTLLRIRLIFGSCHSEASQWGHPSYGQGDPVRPVKQGSAPQRPMGIPAVLSSWASKGTKTFEKVSGPACSDIWAPS